MNENFEPHNAVNLTLVTDVCDKNFGDQSSAYVTKLDVTDSDKNFTFKKVVDQSTIDTLSNLFCC